MLRAVCFKNFVKFKEHQSIVFKDGSPFLFIGENGSGKSSVLEGIRRCLTNKLNTSKSSSFDNRQLSYFICKFESHENKRFISGYLVMPNRPSEFYKFAMKYGNSQSGKTYINLMEVSTLEDTPGETTQTTVKEKSICLKRRYELLNDDLQRKIEAVFNGELRDTDFESYLLSVFREKLSSSEDEAKDCEAILEELSANIVFTFPLHSVGPLQWSKSSRISNEYRQDNYKEAEDRGEIIRCFLEDKNENKFSKETEELYFKRITLSDDYNFELKDRKISLPKGKYELLKTPEGILEAKTFSILMSSKKYKSLVLEEPDKGMHPQFIERMLQIMKENKRKKNCPSNDT